MDGQSEVIRLFKQHLDTLSTDRKFRNRLDEHSTERATEALLAVMAQPKLADLQVLALLMGERR